MGEVRRLIPLPSSSKQEPGMVPGYSFSVLYLLNGQGPTDEEMQPELGSISPGSRVVIEDEGSGVSSSSVWPKRSGTKYEEATGPCRLFNEKKYYFMRCRFRHTCMRCEGAHPAVDCLLDVVIEHILNDGQGERQQGGI